MYQDFLSMMGVDEKYSSKKDKNLLMQLRKLCLHPYLFDGVEDTSLPQFDEHLIKTSGKLMFLDQLV